MEAVQTIAGLGAATTGTGIPEPCLAAGLSVVTEVDEERVACGHSVRLKPVRGFHEPKYRPAPLLEQIVADGHLGREPERPLCTHDANK